MTAGPGEAGERLFSPGFTAIAASMLAFFSAGGMFLPVVPRFAAGPLGATDLAVGVAIGSFAIASLVLRPFVGRLADRRGRRPLLIAGAIVTVVATFGHLAVGDLALLIAMRLLLGAGEALFFVAGMAATTDLAPEHRRGEAISIMSLALYLGVAIGPVAGETLFGLGGYSAVWIVSGVVALVAVVLSWFAPETLDVGARGADSGRLLHPRGIVPGLLVLCGAWGMGAYFAFLPLLTDELELEGTGPLFALYALIVVGLRIAGAKLPDRLGAARLSGAALATSAVGLTTPVLRRRRRVSQSRPSCSRPAPRSPSRRSWRSRWRASRRANGARSSGRRASSSTPHSGCRRRSSGSSPALPGTRPCSSSRPPSRSPGASRSSSSGRPGRARLRAA